VGYFDLIEAGMAQGRYSERGINIVIMAEDILALVKVLNLNLCSNSRFFLWDIVGAVLLDLQPY
jgi:hypothetical protein